jgi:hypothetical protein
VLGFLIRAAKDSRKRSAARPPDAAKIVTTLGAPQQQPISKSGSSERQKNGARRGGSAWALTSPIAAVRLSSFGWRCTARPLSTEKPVTQNSGYARSSRFASLMAASTDGVSYSLYARVPVRLTISTTNVMAFTPNAQS